MMAGNLQNKFENFSKALARLNEIISEKKFADLDELERAGVIQIFEVVFELSWKLMQEFLKEQGYSVAGPRESIKTAFEHGLIDDASVWLEALQDRNLSTHAYNEKTIDSVTERIYTRYINMFNALKDEMNKIKNNS